MKLQRLVEMLRQDRNGAEEWPVLFTGFKQHPSGEWQEVGGDREAITAVEVEEGANEVLLIRDSDCLPLSLSSLEQKLAGLIPRHSDFMVDTCQTPIVVDGQSVHIDLPVVGAGRDEKNRCYLLVYASRWNDGVDAE
jgi:hypothetical protein